MTINHKNTSTHHLPLPGLANTESPSSDSVKVIAFQIESLQRGALPQHSSKVLCTFVCNAIVFQIETFQRCTQDQHLCEADRPATSHALVEDCLPQHPRFQCCRGQGRPALETTAADQPDLLILRLRGHSLPD